ncbi:formate dehydrogenase accessory sulfurtransferase FdhD [Pseudoxanthomonas beigongshangi]
MLDSGEPAPPPVPGCVVRKIQRRQGDATETAIDRLAEEVPVAMRYNGRSFAVMMATPCDLEDFALGFSLSEGLIAHAGELLDVDVHPRVEGIELAMSVSAGAAGARIDDASLRKLPGRGGCGLCGTRELEDVVQAPAPVDATLVFDTGALRRALDALLLHQPMNAATGATHAAAWADSEGRIRRVREDVGRHNALDKLIGAMAREGDDPAAGMLLISSRASYEMVVKAARAGIGFIAAVSAPTALAVELARGAGVCLVGFARAEGYNVYTFPERLRVRP